MTPIHVMPIPRRRWRIAWLLGLGVLVNFFDRVNLTVAHAALVTTFGISTVTFGYLAGAYNWTYAVCQLPVGVLLDRFGIRRVGRASTLLWSVASFAAAISPGLGGLFAARLLLGIGEAPTFPANAKAIGKWFPVEERSFATSIFDAAAKFASAIGVPVIGIVLLTIGWRRSFALTGLVSLLYFAVFWVVYREPEEDVELTEAERNHIGGGQHEVPDAVAEKASLGALLRERKVLGMALGFGAYNYTFYLLLTWLPTYLASALGIDLLHSFLYTGVPWLFATATDLVIGGWLVDWLIKRGWDAHRVRKIVLVCGTACGLGIFGAAHAHTPMRALVWISISIGGLAAAAPVGWSILSIIAPRGSVGTVGGIVNFSNQLSGISAAIVTGYLVEAHHNFVGAFGVAVVYLAVGISSYIWLVGRIERVTIPV